MIAKEKVRKTIATVIRTLPLAGILYGSFLPAQLHLQPWLILAALIWFQTLFMFEIFSGKS